MEPEKTLFEEFVGVAAGSVNEYLILSGKAENIKLREFLSRFYAGSQFMDLMTEANLTILAEQAHSNLVYQNFVYDLQMNVLVPFGRERVELVVEHLAYGIAPSVNYTEGKVNNFYVGPTDDNRFKVTDEDIAARLRANRWLIPLLVLAWAELPESPPDGTD